MRRVLLAAMALWSANAAAQTTYKCVNAQRAITYSNIPCEKQGLKDAGPVSDRTTTLPFVEPASKTAPHSDASKPGAAKDEARGERTIVKPASPATEKPSK